MDIKKAEFFISSAKLSQCPKDTKMEFAFIGRSNVGKSSLINFLTQNNKLAMTSQNPGKTILINHFIINDKWFLVDLPGYGYAKRGKAEMARLKKMIYSYIEGRETLYNLFVLIDSNIPPQKIDLEFIQWLGEHGVPFSIIFTKTDKKSKSEVGKNIAKFNQVLTETWEELPQQFMASAVKKTGRDEILNHIGDILKATKS